MKKIIIGLLLLTSAVGFAYKKDDLIAKGLRFVAPGVNSPTAVTYPEKGEIIFDTTADKFFGFTNAGSWVQLSAGDAIFPTGIIVPYGGTTAPTGFYLCNGQPVQIVGNESLYAAIGTAFGDGTKLADGVTSSGFASGTAFNLPDMGGRFPRGVTTDATRDPDYATRTGANTGGNTGGAVGSVQLDQLKSHTHSFTVGYSGGGTVPANGAGSYVTNTTSAAGGGETRPKNVNVNYIIKR